MAEERGGSVDFWEQLEEAAATVERWPSWQQRYDARLLGEDGDPERIRTSDQEFRKLLLYPC